MISAVTSFLIFGLLQRCTGSSNADTSLEPLITSHFFQTMNPHLHNAIATTLMAEEVIIPPQTISIPIIGTISLNVSTFRIESLDWHPASGLYYRHQALEYWAELDSDMIMEYVTNSHWILPSGKTKIQVSDLKVDIRLRLAFDDTRGILQPVFDRVEVRVREFNIWSTRSWIHWITSRFTGIIKTIVVGQIENTIVNQLPAILEETSKLEFMTPSGLYYSAFTSEPHFTDSGIVLELGLFPGGENSTHHNISKRSFERFERPVPSRYTDLQPFLTKTLLQNIKPIIFESINTELTNLDLISSYLVPVPFSSPIELNITHFHVDGNQVQWHPLTDIVFMQDAIHVDIGISFHVFTKYQTNSRFLLPNSTLNATVRNFRVITDVGFNLVNDALYPDFKTLNITLDKLDISSSTAGINYLTNFFSGLIKSLSSSMITTIVKDVVPDTISQILQSEINIKNMGIFLPKFLKVPAISSHGMLVDMTIVKIDD